MTNSKENQNCMGCAHFQPYENANPLTQKNGECRRLPQFGQVWIAADNYVDKFWPYIHDSTDFWCSRWKKSTQTEITYIGGGSESFPADFTTFRAAPWNRRADMNISCWNCNHYQRDKDDPILPGQDGGECRKNPPPEVYSYDDTVESGVLQPRKFDISGSYYWCSKWERAEGVIPVDPGPQPQD